MSSATPYRPSVASLASLSGSGGVVQVEVSQSLTLGRLPAVMAFLRKMRVVELIDEACPPDPRSKVTHGQCVAVILCGVFVGVHALWRVAERLGPYDMVTVMQDPAFDLEHFTDDRLGRALDAIYMAGLDGIMTQIALRAVDHFAINTHYLRFDTTAFALQGDYASEDAFARVADVAPPPKIVRGHSKDHRPDLKQVMFGMVTADDGGIPLMGGMLDGNTADSVAAAGFFQRIRAVVRDPREVVCVADCKAWCLPVLARCQADDLRLLSRLPRNFALHSQMLALEGPLEVVEVGGERCEIIAADVVESGVVMAEQDDGTVTRTPVMVQARAVRVYSPSLMQSKRATLERSRLRERREVDRAVAGWQNRTYACEADARADAERQILEQDFDTWSVQLAQVTSLEGPVKRRRGRPRKTTSAGPAAAADTATDAVHWRVTYTVQERDAASLERYLRAQATYVLIRTQQSDWTLPDAEMISAYRRQFVVEQGFSWLKSTAVINPMYLHTPHRIASLGFIYCVGLMTWNLMQRQVRTFLKANQRGLPYHRGKPSNHITTRFLFELFDRLSTTTIQLPGGPPVKVISNQDGWMHLSLQALGIDESVLRPVLPSGENNFTNMS